MFNLKTRLAGHLIIRCERLLWQKASQRIETLFEN